MITRIAIDGGPCGGKTTLLTWLKRKLEDYGFSVYLVKEAATSLIESGMKLKEALAPEKQKQFFRYEEIILDWQLFNESVMERCAGVAGDEKAVILCDRGIPSIRAYLPQGIDGHLIFIDFLKRRGLSEAAAFARYEGVIHMVTAANGAEKYFTAENNAARTESLEEARRLDEFSKAAWNGHQHLMPIDNSTDIEGKLNRALRATCRILGIPQPIEI